MLMILPLPILIKWRQSFRQYVKTTSSLSRCLLTLHSRKVQIMILLTLGVFIIAITIVRLPQNHSKAYAQVNRTTWASTELFVAAFAVNAHTLYSLRRRTTKTSNSYPTPRNGSSALQTIGSMPGRMEDGNRLSRIRKDTEFDVRSTYRVSRRIEPWDNEDEIPLEPVDDGFSNSTPTSHPNTRPRSYRSEGDSMEKLPQATAKATAPHGGGSL